MVIREIVVRQLCLPLTKPYKVSFRTYTEFEPIIVEMTAADGTVGWGEAYVPAGSTRETAESAWKFCCSNAEKLVGRTTAEIGEVIDAEVQESPFAACAMLSAVAMAIRHPALTVDTETRVPLLVPVSATDKESIAAEIEERLDQGYRTFKVKVGWDVDADLQRVRWVQQALRGRAAITMDANRGYDVVQGARFASELDPKDILLFEQPCEADEWEANSQIARISKVPLMLDESIRGVRDIERAATLPGVRYVKLKLKRIGGVDRALVAMRRARDLGLGICLGDGVATEIMCWVEACVSRGYLAGAGDMNGFLKPKTRLLANPLPFERGNIVLRPGYWPEVDRTILKAHQKRESRYSAMATA
ncbi:MAG: mandelate racemase/muconate lactonizing enzyme family protein [Burkholderiales bacterium]|nr:mandelate racemase/muconate lactonizing enzyme family protein [Burkholderiales bacterium]